MSNRKSTARRRTAKKSSGGSVWPWVLMLGVVAGGIQAYEHRDSLLPQRAVAKATSSAANAPKVTTAAKREAVTSEKVAAMRPAAPVLPGNAPVPPRPVAMPPTASQNKVAAILPETRPSVEKVSLGEKRNFCLLRPLRPQQLCGRWQHLLDEGRQNAARRHRGSADRPGALHGRTPARFHCESQASRNAERRRLRCRIYRCCGRASYGTDTPFAFRRLLRRSACARRSGPSALGKKSVLVWLRPR